MWRKVSWADQLMNFFRKKKKPEDVQKSQNEHLLDELCNVLKTHGIMFFFSFHLLFVKMCLMMSRKNWIFDKFLSIWYHSDFMLFLFYTLYLRYFFKTRRCNSSGENKININYTYIGYFKLIFSKNNGRLVI